MAEALNGGQGRLRRASRWGVVAAMLAAVSLLVPALAAAQSAAQMPGLNAHLMWSGVSEEEQDRQLGLIAEAGAKIVRVDVGWSSLESDQKGTYEGWYLDRLDTLVDKAAQHSVKLLFTFTDSPCWASTAPESLKQDCEGSWWDRGVQRYPPADARDYANALAFVVRRYGDRVAAWEIWNEPNLDYFFTSPDQPRDYARIVRAAYPAAKAAHPSATIVAGALAESPAGFVEELFEHGIGGHFDAFSIHPYAGDASPFDPMEDEWIKNSFVRGIPSVRDVLLSHGEDKPIWLTEFGWSTSTIRDDAAWRNGVSEQTQALYTEQALIKVRDWPYVQAAIVFELLDERDAPDVREYNFGLLHHDWSPKPAYEAFRRGADVLSGAVPPPPSGDVALSESEYAEGEPDHTGEDTGDIVVSRTQKRTRKRLRLGIRRYRGRMIARGRATPHTRPRLRAHRYLRGKRRFARRSAYKLRVKVGRSGRFKRKLNRRLHRGRWRVVVSYPRMSDSRRTRARLTLRRGRSV